MKIYDCFLFFNELELLEIRLNVLNDYVDYFVLVESTKTFSNKDKELHYQKNKPLFKKFDKKIIHIIIDEHPKFDNTKDAFGDVWHYDHFQRNQITRGLVSAKEEDLILLSDLDEIVNPLLISELKKEKNIVALSFLTFYYYINYLRKETWYAPKVFRKKHLKKFTPQQIRDWSGPIKVYPKGGWHFSFLGGEERIKYKIKSYAHQQYNNKEVFENITKNINEGKDIFNRGTEMKIIDINNLFPEYIVKNQNKYKHLIKKND